MTDKTLGAEANRIPGCRNQQSKDTASKSRAISRMGKKLQLCSQYSRTALCIQKSDMLWVARQNRVLGTYKTQQLTAGECQMEASKSLQLGSRNKSKFHKALFNQEQHWEDALMLYSGKEHTVLDSWDFSAQFHSVNPFHSRNGQELKVAFDAFPDQHTHQSSG